MGPLPEIAKAHNAACTDGTLMYAVDNAFVYEEYGVRIGERFDVQTIDTPEGPREVYPIGTAFWSWEEQNDE